MCVELREGSSVFMGVHNGSELWTCDTLLFLGILVCSQSGHYPKADFLKWPLPKGRFFKMAIIPRKI
jgi:hypothetical protein